MACPFSFFDQAERNFTAPTRRLRRLGRAAGSRSPPAREECRVAVPGAGCTRGTPAPVIVVLAAAPAVVVAAQAGGEALVPPHHPEDRGDGDELEGANDEA
jgi:hypothetical protein